MPKIYDCFSFFNEVDLLDIRLNELDSIVDYFVIIESTRTFMKKEKPLVFDIFGPRFNQLKERITKIIVSGQYVFNRNIPFKSFSLTEPFPQYIFENVQKYGKLLCPLK